MGGKAYEERYDPLLTELVRCRIHRFNTFQGWDRLFSGIKQISSIVKVNNVNERLTKKIDYLNSIGLVNSVDQYEMKLKIKDWNKA